MQLYPQPPAEDLSQFSAGRKLANSEVALEFAPQVLPRGKPFLPTMELELGPALRKAASTLPARGNRSLAMFPECHLPAGIPDLVALVTDQVALRFRIESGVPPIISEQEVRIIAKASPQKGTSLNSIVAVTGVSDSQARRLLRRLVTDGALRKANDRWYRNPCLGPIGRTYALEAKVSDWRSGFAQSLRYGGYADATGLVLGDVSRKVRESALEAATHHNVGLFLNDRWVKRPSIHRLPAERRLWVSEYIVANLFQKQA